MQKSFTSTSRLLCNHLANPIGIEDQSPILSWIMLDKRTGASQTAYQIVAASTPEILFAEPDLWDSGKTVSNESAAIPYNGKALASSQLVYWAVRVWDQDDVPSPYSKPACFEMGLLEKEDWVPAEWIGKDTGKHDQSQPVPWLRKTFAIGENATAQGAQPIRARLYVAARGLCETYLNGRKLGDACLSPGWTDFNKHIQYVTHDCTALIQQGEQNTVGIILGEGWYSGYLGWSKNRNVWGTTPSALVKLVVTYSDDSCEEIVSDDTWEMQYGPILASDIYNGESYDARKELPGWSEPSSCATGWEPVEMIDAPASGVRLTAKRMQPVRRIESVIPRKVTQLPDGKWLFDLGQNITGWARLKVAGPEGTQITLRFGEMLQEDGTLYTENLRSAKATDRYTLKGAMDGETWEPRFTFHGFRYVEISGFPGTPNKEAVTGIVLHNDMPPTGSFSCSHAKLNQLQSNIQWGQRGNFLEVPTDCPQRDERLGWTGDAQIFIKTATFNYDVAAFFNKWLIDLEDAQHETGAYPNVAPDLFNNVDGNAAWADAGIICPWIIYERYGDTEVLRRQYASMARYMEWQASEDGSENWIRNDSGFGDWVAIDAVTPGAAPTPKDLIGTAYFAWTSRLMAKIASILGKDEDARKYDTWHDQIRDAFNQEYVTPAGRVVGHTQTGYLLALAFDLLPENKREQALGQLVHLIESRDWSLTTGFVGTPLLCPVLTRMGRPDIAYKLILREEYPGWLYTVNQGATTMWERWNSYVIGKGFGPVSMNSFNHYAYGSVGEWLYAVVGGLDIDASQPGGRRWRISPIPGGNLTWATAELDSRYGKAAVSWQLDKSKGRFELNLTIPPNTTALVRIPTEDAASIKESDRPLVQVESIQNIVTEDGGLLNATQCEVLAGTYRFSSPLKKGLPLPDSQEKA